MGRFSIAAHCSVIQPSLGLVGYVWTFLNQKRRDGHPGAKSQKSFRALQVEAGSLRKEGFQALHWDAIEFRLAGANVHCAQVATFDQIKHMLPPCPQMR